MHIDVLFKKVKCMYSNFKILNSFLLWNKIRMVLVPLVQSIYSYRIFAWGGAYEVHLKLLEITINSLLRIAFYKPYRTNTNLL